MKTLLIIICLFGCASHHVDKVSLPDDHYEDAYSARSICQQKCFTQANKCCHGMIIEIHGQFTVDWGACKEEIIDKCADQGQKCIMDCLNKIPCKYC